MKKILLIICFIAMFCLVSLKANALTFEEGFNQSDKKPVLVLVYAQWADNYQLHQQRFKAAQKTFADKYNFVEMDIANNDAHFFNSRYHIYPNLPYVLMFRDGGRVSRYVPRECAIEQSCLNSKLKSFIP